MSAADPAGPTPPPMSFGGRAIVIDLHRRKKGSRTAVNAQPPDHRRSDSELIADHVEKHFLAAGLSLTDDRTARAFRSALDVVEDFFGGAAANDVITDAQRRALVELLTPLRAAPDLV